MREFELALQAKLFLILTALFLVSDIKTQDIDSKEALPFREITAHPE
jgi:hypothetical protein